MAALIAFLLECVLVGLFRSAGGLVLQAGASDFLPLVPANAERSDGAFVFPSVATLPANL
jgi:hypothetical protein